MNQNDIISSKSMIENILTGFTPMTGNDLSTVWKTVVSQIGKKKNEENDEITLGERIAVNTHVVDFKNGVLLVEANHSGWVQYLKMYQNFIIKGLKWKLPNLDIKNFAFRVAGSNAKLSDSYDDDLKKNQDKMNKKIEAQEKLLNSEFKSDNQNGSDNLPPEVLAMFDKLRNSVDNSNN